MTADIEQINPRNVAALAAWHATVVAADTHGREATATPWQLPEVQADLADQTDAVKLVLGGIEDGRTMVVAGQVHMPLTHSRDLAVIEVFVHPEHRRRGHGSRMLEQLEVVARGHGRSLLETAARWPYDGPADGAGTPGLEFLRRHGFRLGLVDVMRSVDLPVDDARLAALAAEAAPHHAAYTLRSFVGPVPDELAQGWAELEATLMVEAPTGDLEREAESADVDELRRYEAVIEAQGRTKLNTVALDAAGELVAYTDLVVSAHDPDKAFQWGTLVRPDHRGHRLGLAVKVANLRLLQSSAPSATRLLTWNAEVNTHMVEVNEALGFKPLERVGELQKRLPAGG
ncbi:GNAT family N-acetyltransferase [Nocardioides sp. GCM10027113]|uniref:GNAT family N-acetyltransferase n=1 Tax=unclassified Nocardioides TaxID=2615069 RepID=UPI003605AF84